MAKFRRKAIDVEAEQLREDTLHKILGMLGPDIIVNAEDRRTAEYIKEEGLSIYGRNGVMTACIGDWFIEDVEVGWYYVCDASAFPDLYEEVS